ncbi:Protein-glutamate O-methyltransferase C1393,13 [Ceratobasidium theobromae]|uniref:Protein-glutamate O-methyltransferase C1393,13 n=1 Tax=Ceratobasidium theobromae TaxID=1582974 RepID=A0A5N5QJ47_9AGAM|nr:Protein-glutamate O-methyltransferase C1393,13 [Ceratobasidium theobromae]
MADLEERREELQPGINGWEDKLAILFAEMVQMCLWGNATDLSMLPSMDPADVALLQAVGEDKTHLILRNDAGVLWEHVRGLKDARIDFVLDNAGFELFTDLVFADFLITFTPYADKAVFHPKPIPWFVSDVTPSDWAAMFRALKDPNFFTTLDKSMTNPEALKKMASRWEEYAEKAVFALSPEDMYAFWVAPGGFWEIAPGRDGEAVGKALDGSGLVIFKGDLNYRKLTGDVKWPNDTPWEKAIGPLAGRFPLVSLRTSKADVIVGLGPGVAERLDADPKETGWRASGKLRNPPHPLLRIHLLKLRKLTAIHVMRAFSLLVAFASPSLAQQSTYLLGLLDALRSHNLTSLGSAAVAVVKTSEGAALLAQLSQGEKTLFAPNNEAFSRLSNPQNTPTNKAFMKFHQDPNSDPSLLATVLSYHVVDGYYNPSDIVVGSIKHGILRTLLTNSSYVNLEGSKSQALVVERFSATDGEFYVLNPIGTKVSRSFKYQDLMVYEVNEVLIPPGSMTEASDGQNHTFVIDSLKTVGVLASIEAAKGATIFIPKYGYFGEDSVNPAIATQPKNITRLSEFVANHVVMGRTLYGADLVSNPQNVVSSGGQPYSFITNSSGSFVTSGSFTSEIIGTDFTMANGVIHLIGNPLLNSASNPMAASSAASRASVVATVSTTASATKASASSANAPASNASIQAANSLLSISVISILVLGMGGLIQVGGMLAF